MCSTILQKNTVYDQEIDFCPHCRGIWFDNEEISRHLHKLSKEKHIPQPEARVLEKRNVKTVYQLTETTRECPVCNETMRKLNYLYDSNVFVDRCPQCHGIWVDGGEVELLASFLKEDPLYTALGNTLADMERKKTINRIGTSNTHHQRGSYRTGIIPLSDEAPTIRFPVITFSLILFQTVIFILQSLFVSDSLQFFRSFGLIPAHFSAFNLVTAIFIHGNVSHLVFNVFYLWIFGDNVEDRIGRIPFLIFFITSGVVANLIYVALNAPSTIPVLGASGAIAGALGAYCIFYPQNKIKVLCFGSIIYPPAYIFLGSWVILQIIGYILTHGSIAYEAHIAGFIFGVIGSLLYKYVFEKTLTHNTSQISQSRQ